MTNKSKPKPDQKIKKVVKILAGTSPISNKEIIKRNKKTKKK